ncbi:MAG: flagellar assembly protein FliW [Epsilonproteobacteria bacterium]|nr:flagellar assembly protein FliW [Campylobacterota bacterium]
MKFEVVLPILGFENIKEFELEKIDDIFFKLSGENVSFTLINPYALRDYEIIISQKDKEALGINDDSNILILNAMIIAKPLQNSTINFASPIIFNFDNKKMGQVIPQNAQDYALTDPLANYIKE